MRHNSRQLESHKRKALLVVGGDARVVGHPVVRHGIHLCLEVTEDRLVHTSRLRRKIVLVELVVLLAALRANALLARQDGIKEDALHEAERPPLLYGHLVRVVESVPRAWHLDSKLLPRFQTRR